jgi:hypothetical protein
MTLQKFLLRKSPKHLETTAFTYTLFGGYGIIILIASDAEPKLFVSAQAPAFKVLAPGPAPTPAL